jgi:hypothetical protein
MFLFQVSLGKTNMMTVTCGQGNLKVIVGQNQSHLSQYCFSKGIGPYLDPEYNSEVLIAGVEHKKCVLFS